MRRFLTITMGGAGVAALLAVCAAVAQEPPPSPPPGRGLFRRLQERREAAEAKRADDKRAQDRTRDDARDSDDFQKKADQDNERAAFFQRMKELMGFRKDEWPYEYEYWKSRGRL